MLLLGERRPGRPSAFARVRRRLQDASNTVAAGDRDGRSVVESDGGNTT
jgi:hypothetical protein